MIKVGNNTICWNFSTCPDPPSCPSVCRTIPLYNTSRRSLATLTATGWWVLSSFLENSCCQNFTGFYCRCMACKNDQSSMICVWVSFRMKRENWHIAIGCFYRLIYWTEASMNERDYDPCQAKVFTCPHRGTGVTWSVQITINWIYDEPDLMMMGWLGSRG